MLRPSAAFWVQFIFVLGVSAALGMAYYTGTRVTSLPRAADWSPDADKPLPPDLRRHATWGLIGGGAALLTGLSAFRNGHLSTLQAAVLAMALAAILSGILRLYAGGRGKWHMGIVLVALLAFGGQLGVSATTALYAARGRAGADAALMDAGAGATPDREQATAMEDASGGAPGDELVLRVEGEIKSSTVQTDPTGGKQGREIRAVSVEGAASGDLAGHMILEFRQVGVPDNMERNLSGQIQGRMRILDAETGSTLYQGMVLGLVRLSGVTEILAGLDGANPDTFGRHVELAGYMAPPALENGATFPITLRGRYVRRIRLDRFSW